MDGFFSLTKTDLPSLKLRNPKNNEMAIQLAVSDVDANCAYRIRHDGYLSYKYITQWDNGLFVDRYDGRENVRTVIVFKDGRAAATVRVCLFDVTSQFPDAERVPAMEIFDTEIRELMRSLARSGPATRAVEVTRMARLPEFSSDMGIIHALFRAVGYLILFFDADVVLNACRPHHMPMYRRFGFQKLEEPRQYPNLTYKAGLMGCFRSTYGSAAEKLSFLNGISTDDHQYVSLIAGERTMLAPVRSPERRFAVGVHRLADVAA